MTRRKRLARLSRVIGKPGPRIGLIHDGGGINLMEFIREETEKGNWVNSEAKTYAFIHLPPVETPQRQRCVREYDRLLRERIVGEPLHDTYLPSYVVQP